MSDTAGKAVFRAKRRCDRRGDTTLVRRSKSESARRGRITLTLVLTLTLGVSGQVNN